MFYNPVTELVSLQRTNHVPSKVHVCLDNRRISCVFTGWRRVCEHFYLQKTLHLLHHCLLWTDDIDDRQKESQIGLQGETGGTWWDMSLTLLPSYAPPGRQVETLTE